MSINWQVGKQNVVHPDNGLSLRHKKREVLVNAKTWMNLKNIILVDRGQMQKATYCMIPFMCNVQKKYIYRDRKLGSHLPSVSSSLKVHDRRRHMWLLAQFGS